MLAAQGVCMCRWHSDSVIATALRLASCGNIPPAVYTACGAQSASGLYWQPGDSLCSAASLALTLLEVPLAS